MGFFDFFSKKEVTLEECLSALLRIQAQVENTMLQQFSKSWNGGESGLIYEVRILTLWIMTISIPSQSIRDKLHSAFCDKIETSESEIDLFYKDLQKRYNNYFSAFNMWQDGAPTGAMILGSTIYDIVINQNKDLSLESGDLPLTGLTNAQMGMSIFSTAFDASLNSIKKQGLADTIKKYD